MTIISQNVNWPIQYWIKYSFDRAVSGLVLFLLLPLLVVVAVLVRIFMGAPIFFTQERAGYQGRPFVCYKFRTMTDARDASGRLLSDTDRLTGIGKLFRRLKVDELPQLWNIFSGDMSFVGPRPTLPVQVENYDAYARQRLAVIPGLTGWAQVNGNIQLSWPDRIHLDVWYVKHWSLWLDFVILFKTLGVVIWGEHSSPKALDIALGRNEAS